MKKKAKKKKPEKIKVHRLPDGHCFAVVSSDQLADFIKKHLK